MQIVNLISALLLYVQSAISPVYVLNECPNGLIEQINYHNFSGDLVRVITDRNALWAMFYMEGYLIQKVPSDVLPWGSIYIHYKDSQESTEIKLFYQGLYWYLDIGNCGVYAVPDMYFKSITAPIFRSYSDLTKNNIDIYTPL